MIQAMLFISSSDPELERIQSDLNAVQNEYSHILHIVDIDRDAILME